MKNSNYVPQRQLCHKPALSQQPEVRSGSPSSTTKSVSTAPPYCRPGRRKPGDYFSQKQISELESRFKPEIYPRTTEINQLALFLKLTPCQIKRWFERRRVKFKRERWERLDKTLDLTAAEMIRERSTVPVPLDSEAFPPCYATALDSEVFPPCYETVPTNGSTQYTTSTVTTTVSNDHAFLGRFPDFGSFNQSNGSVPVAYEMYNNTQQHQTFSTSGDCITPEQSAWQNYSSNYIS